MMNMTEVFERDRKRVEEARERGERIRPSPEFIGMFVRILRYQTRWKQSTLANMARHRSAKLGCLLGIRVGK